MLLPLSFPIPSFLTPSFLILGAGLPLQGEITQVRKRIRQPNGLVNRLIMEPYNVI